MVEEACYTYEMDEDAPDYQSWQDFNVFHMEEMLPHSIPPLLQEVMSQQRPSPLSHFPAFTPNISTMYQLPAYHIDKIIPQNSHATIPQNSHAPLQQTYQSPLSPPLSPVTTWNNSAWKPCKRCNSQRKNQDDSATTNKEINTSCENEPYSIEVASFFSSNKPLLTNEFSMENIPGRYNFQYCLQKNIKKNSNSWTLSEKLNKLYIQKDALINVEFKTNITLEKSSAEVRAYLRYKDVESEIESVDTCPNHQTKWADEKIEKHCVLQSNPIYSMYVKCPQTGRYILRLHPHYKNELSFQCWSTCSGGINRRNVVLVFALYICDVFEAQCIVDVKICSSPLRDCVRDEKHIEPQTKKEKEAFVIPCSMKVEDIPEEVFRTKAIKLEIPEGGRRIAELLCQLSNNTWRIAPAIDKSSPPIKKQEEPSCSYELSDGSKSDGNTAIMSIRTSVIQSNKQSLLPRSISCPAAITKKRSVHIKVRCTRNPWYKPTSNANSKKGGYEPLAKKMK